MDYGHALHFGVFLPPRAEQADLVVTAALEADLLGLDSVSVQDHPYQPAYLDTWTLLTHIAARTERISVFPNVANLPLRPPAVLARSVASLDILSDGRAELGLGAGAFWDAIEALGGPRRTPRQAVDALEEAIGVIRALWTPGRTPRIDGEHYRLDGAKPGPFPVHPVGIWLGAYKPRMLELTGRLADGWLPSLGYAAPDDLPWMNDVIDESAASAGREPADVRRLLNIQGSFTGNGFLQGPPEVWVEQLAGLAVDEGISGFVLMADVADRRDLHRFAEEVAPAVRELVEAERTVPPLPRDEGPVEVASALPEGDAAPVSGDGDHLVAIHDHLRTELAQVRDLVRQVERGHVDVGDARSMINTMTMRQNSWTLGTYCESYCRVVTTHHTIEDVNMFPRLVHADPSLAPVVERLEREHHEVAAVLEDVDRALVAMVSTDGGVDDVRRAVGTLSDVLLAHLAYEESQLVGPLNRLSVGI
jgi:alkanesulfonate monooxygenase SsuD/methylene tetrahydromethanopterin reductase-like flavin-dependent oxidoreductase (luciferase family)/hemerythrin-like domain-containing protein